MHPHSALPPLFVPLLLNPRSRSERILDVADLAALPPGRALVFSSGNRPTLIRPAPWWQSPHADAIRASLAAHGPGITTPTR